MRQFRFDRTVRSEPPRTRVPSSLVPLGFVDHERDRAGLVIVDPSDGDKAVDVSLGTTRCVVGTSPSGLPMSTTTIPGRRCPIGARSVAVDDFGDVYFVPSAGSPTPVDQVGIPPKG